jgi:excinuclease ABC subunit B
MKTEKEFRLVSDFSPAGSQPEAIGKLNGGLEKGERFQTLLGVTGSGKTFTIANVIADYQKPVLVLAHNKTLAAQLYNEFKEFFPENRVEYFVSYYDYYQPESYLPQKDQYIEKDAQINPKIEQMRLAATASLLSRTDVIVVASVSAIYGLGNPENFENLGFELKTGDRIKRNDLLMKLVDILFERNDTELMPGRFRVRGDTIDLIPGYFNNIIRIEMFGDEIERISEVDKNTGDVLESMKYFFVYPARHYVIPEEEKAEAIEAIRAELEERLPALGPLEAHRLKQRTLYDLEMIEETGSCKGIENYSRHFDRRAEGEKPFCLLDYFPDDFLLVVDESHQTLPQVRGMYNGDRSRKTSLVDYGFRLPSAFDNRPLVFSEFEEYMRHVIFVSATPGIYEEEHSENVVEQIIRPTGLVDPLVEIRPVKGQMADVLEEIRKTTEKGDRVLITTLTKKLAEELTEFLASKEIKTRYLHSDIQTIERTEIIRELRLGKFDVLVGINLLREGLDIPEVGFIGILDADKEGFLRDSRSLIQIIGRAARNVNSHVVLYADKITDSIKKAVSETERRRNMQTEFNRVHGIVPVTIKKPVREKEVDIKDIKHIPKAEIPNLIIELEADMDAAAESLDFERAIVLRDRIKQLREETEEGGGKKRRGR